MTLIIKLQKRHQKFKLQLLAAAVRINTAGNLATTLTLRRPLTAHRTLVFDTPRGKRVVDRPGMEGDDYHRRHYEQHSNYTSGRGYAPNPRAMSGSGVSQRIRPTQQLSSIRSPTSASRMGAAEATNSGLAGYAFPQSHQYPTPAQQTSLQYQPEFGQDTQRQQHQQFQQFSQNMLYNVQPQAQSQSQSQSPYDTVQSYQPRQSAAIEVLSNQFGVPPYYSSSEPTSIAGVAPIAQQYATGQFSQLQQSSSTGRTTMPASYPGVLPEYSQSAAPDQMEPQAAARENNYDAAYNRYLESLSQIFQDVRDGRLTEAAHSLLEVSEWLLGSAVDLGLTRDEQELQSERAKLWNDFNTCWLAVLQKQKDSTQEVLASGRNVLPPQSMIQTSFLKRMGDKLVSLVDGMESHGLVDYEMGIWEEEIISVLTDCLALHESIDHGNQERVASGPSVAASSSR